MFHYLSLTCLWYDHKENVSLITKLFVIKQGDGITITFNSPFLSTSFNSFYLTLSHLHSYIVHVLKIFCIPSSIIFYCSLPSTFLLSAQPATLFLVHVLSSLCSSILCHYFMLWVLVFITVSLNNVYLCNVLLN